MSPGLTSARAGDRNVAAIEATITPTKTPRLMQFRHFSFRGNSIAVSLLKRFLKNTATPAVAVWLDIVRLVLGRRQAVLHIQPRSPTKLSADFSRNSPPTSHFSSREFSL